MVNSRAKGIYFKKVKLASQTKTTDITLANDDELVTPTLPIGSYQITFQLFITSTANPDFKYEIATTGTIAGYGGSAGLSGTIPSVLTALDATVLVTMTSAASLLTIICSCNVSVPGIVSLQWAQQTSHADSTTVRRDSSMVILKS